ncbi:MAG TPA: SurA N-terminal domain-containing protein, partial [Anaerolineales bacterium]|nr:SurA N-terminal domain-containing protein [Anaerolineales bacterium]
MFSQRTFIPISLILLTALGLSACASLSPAEPTATPSATFTPEPSTATPEPLALTVNGEGITVVEFDAEVARYITSQEALGRTVASADATSAVIEDLTAQLLLAQGARADGFNLDDVALQARIDALAAQISGAGNLSAWQAEHGYSAQTFRSALKRG